MEQVSCAQGGVNPAVAQKPGHWNQRCLRLARNAKRGRLRRQEVKQTQGESQLRRGQVLSKSPHPSVKRKLSLEDAVSSTLAGFSRGYRTDSDVSILMLTSKGVTAT